MADDKDPRVEMFEGVGPEIAAIIVQDRERTANIAIGVMDSLEKEVERLREENANLRFIVDEFMYSENARQRAVAAYRSTIGFSS